MHMLLLVAVGGCVLCVWLDVMVNIHKLLLLIVCERQGTELFDFAYQLFPVILSVCDRGQVTLEIWTLAF